MKEKRYYSCWWPLWLRYICIYFLCALHITNFVLVYLPTICPRFILYLCFKLHTCNYFAYFKLPTYVRGQGARQVALCTIFFSSLLCLNPKKINWLWVQLFRCICTGKVWLFRGIHTVKVWLFRCICTVKVRLFRCISTDTLFTVSRSNLSLPESFM